MSLIFVASENVVEWVVRSLRRNCSSPLGGSDICVKLAAEDRCNFESYKHFVVCSSSRFLYQPGCAFIAPLASYCAFCTLGATKGCWIVMIEMKD